MTKQDGRILFIGSAAISPDILQEEYETNCFIIASELDRWETDKPGAIEAEATKFGDATTVVVIEVNYAAHNLTKEISEILGVVNRRAWETIFIDDVRYAEFTEEMVELLRDTPPKRLGNTASLDDIKREIDAFLEAPEGRPREWK